MKRRVLTGLLVGIAWALVLRYLPGTALFPVLILVSLVCQWEFYRLLERGGMQVCPGLGLTWGVLWLVVGYAFPPGATALAVLARQVESLTLVAGGFALFILLMFDARRRRSLEAAALTVLGFFYVPFMLSFFLRLAQWGVTQPFGISREGIFLAFYTAAVVKLGDAGAYGVGMSLGRHKLLPRISPGKSWEGLAGGLCASVLVSVLTVLAVRAWPAIPGGPLATLHLMTAVGVGLALGAVGTLGDLVESMFKRAVRAKDSSGLLPGMGGILDIFDSLTFTPVLMYFLLIWCLT
jgi:phosphatidate cytidylyltransferase